MAITLFKRNEIDSTNDYAKRLLKKRPELLHQSFVVIADRQTHGKGTKGRTWYSDSDGGLYYSLALVPHSFQFDSIEFYHQAIAEAIRSVVATLTPVALSIRFPNDLYIGEKKVGGILMESAMNSAQDSQLDYLIIGIGLNINQSSFPQYLSNIATSLALETQRTYSKKQFVKPLTQTLLPIFGLTYVKE